MIRLGAPEQRLGDAEALLHAAGERAHRLVAHLVEVGQLEQRVHLLPPRPLVADPLQHRDVVEQEQRRDARIDAEVLRQIAQPAPQLLRLGQHVEAVEHDRPLVRLLQSRDRAHQRRLPRAVGSEEPEQSAPDREIHPVEGAHAVAVGLRESGNGQQFATLPFQCSFYGRAGERVSGSGAGGNHPRRGVSQAQWTSVTWLAFRSSRATERSWSDERSPGKGSRGSFPVFTSSART